MAKDSILGDIIKGSFKNPILGFGASAIFAVIGLYLSSKTGSMSGVGKMFSSILYMFSGLVCIVSIIGYLKNKISHKEHGAFFDSKKTLDDLKQLSWKEFEEFVGSLFRRLGYTAEVTGGLKDGGIDLVVKKNGKSHLVQCKQYRISQVTLSMVRDFYGAISSKRTLESGFFVTTGIFILEAKKFTEENSIEAIDGARLMEYIAMTHVSGERVSPVRASNTQAVKQEEKLCPTCGASMVQRVAKQGANAGKPFWGCSIYPKCKAIVPA